jgi:hypothetical protein
MRRIGYLASKVKSHHHVMMPGALVLANNYEFHMDEMPSNLLAGADQ